jgi:hypothetical protein
MRTKKSGVFYYSKCSPKGKEEEILLKSSHKTRIPNPNKIFTRRNLLGVFLRFRVS